MGIETICEFVESQEIFDELRRIGVDYAQGYFISKPEPLDRFENVSFWPR
jgi:EAL domain-containing protein (putative c-di-GMP-specific phosphodiesterase class I)